MMFQTTSVAYCPVIVISWEKEIWFEVRSLEFAQTIINCKLDILICWEERLSEGYEVSNGEDSNNIIFFCAGMFLEEVVLFGFGVTIYWVDAVFCCWHVLYFLHYQIFLYNKILLENKLLLLHEVGDLKNLKPYPSRYSDCLWDGRSRDWIPVGSIFSASVQTGSEAHPTSSTMGTGSLPGVMCSQGVTLTPHPLLVPRSKME